MHIAREGQFGLMVLVDRADRAVIRTMCVLESKWINGIVTTLAVAICITYLCLGKLLGCSNKLWPWYHGGKKCDQHIRLRAMSDLRTRIQGATALPGLR